ncbi:MAG: ABC transporter substrate-binding protein [Xanthobacteraceae bacterium]
MRRREFTTLVGSSALAFAVGARAQEGNRVPTVGVIMNYAESDPEAKTRFSALREQLGKHGWTDGNNIQIEVRWAAGKTGLMLAYASQFVSQPADVIVANSTPLLAVLKQLTSAVSIVFVQVADPVGSGFVSSYARPAGNITGFTDFEPSIAGKWLEVLKEIAPQVVQVTVLLDPDQTNHPTFLRAIESAAQTTKTQIFAAEAHNRQEIEQAFTSVAGQPNRGLIVLPGPVNNTARDTIIQLAARFRLPAVYPFKYYAKDGGLLYYGVNQVDQWSKAASYVDRILRGEKPSALPVQSPTKYELIINLKTAQSLGLNVPATLLATADEVIE